MDELDHNVGKIIDGVLKELDKELDRIGLYDVETTYGVLTFAHSGADEEGGVGTLDFHDGSSVVMIDATRLINGNVAWSDAVLEPVLHRMAEEINDESDDRFLERMDEVLDDGWEEFD